MNGCPPPPSHPPSPHVVNKGLPPRPSAHMVCGLKVCLPLPPPQLTWIEASHLEDETKVSSVDKYDAAWAKLRDADGVLVPGGFGNRGIEGMILAANYARTNKVPYLGICLGMQVRAGGRAGAWVISSMCRVMSGTLLSIS